MKWSTILAAAICVAAGPATSRVAKDAANWNDLSSRAAKEVCNLADEKSDGRVKTCYYRCNSGERSIDIKPTSLCPLTL